MSIKCECSELFDKKEFKIHFKHCKKFYNKYKDFDTKISHLLKIYLDSISSLSIIKFFLERYIKLIDYKRKILESQNLFNELPKPIKEPKYIDDSREIFTNLYEIKMSKELNLYEYPFEISPEINGEDLTLKGEIINACIKKIKDNYDDSCFISGNFLYSMKKISEPKEIKVPSNLQAINEYIIKFQKYKNERLIRQEDLKNDILAQKFIRRIIMDILHCNPKLEFYQDMFVIKDEKIKKEAKKTLRMFHPGFTLDFKEIDIGFCLSINLKNKIIDDKNILDYIKKSNGNKEKINSNLNGKYFKFSFAKKKYKIHEINFDRNPKNTEINYSGKRMKLIQYYKEKFKINIKDENQPLIAVLSKDKRIQYFAPELCYLEGFDDNEIQNGSLMQTFSNYLQLNPNEKITKINTFINLLKEPTRKDESKLSAKEKSDFYGIEIRQINTPFISYNLEETKLIGKNNIEINISDRAFPVLEKKDMMNWACFYEKNQNNYDTAEKFYNSLCKASKAYGFNIEEPKWIEIEENSDYQNWLIELETLFSTRKKEINFVVFLLGKNNNNELYTKLKTHSLCQNGYVSQVVKLKSLQKENINKICSKILLQLNAKLGGISYKINNQIKEIEKMMVLGVDSCYDNKSQSKNIIISMIATINDSFTNFFNKQEFISDENKSQVQYCISKFIKEAIKVFKKENNSLPKGIIIYRKGISLDQKKNLDSEFSHIDEFCKNNYLLYYYIFVDTKPKLKIFEKSNKGEFINPGNGLLSKDGITNKNCFEFYIQPQEVSKGSATPTYYKVLYGTLNIPDIIYKFTYDLCHIYSNWQGVIRIPNVLKAAEKLLKITEKYTHENLNSNLKFGQAYL